MLTNLGCRIGGTHAEPMCLFWKWFSDTLKQVERYSLHPLFHNQTSLSGHPLYLLFSVKVCILSMLILAFLLLSIVHKGSNLATIRESKMANLLRSCSIIWEMTVSAIWARLFYCSPGVVCVLLEKRVSFEDGLLLHITVTFDPAAFASLRWLFDLFSHSDPPGEIELVWNW